MSPERLRPWHRLSVRLAAFFASVTVLAVSVVGLVTYERQRRAVEDTVGTQLLNMARVVSLMLDPKLHAEARRIGTTDSTAYRRLHATLAAVQNELVLGTPLRTLTDFDPAHRQARLVVVSSGPGAPGEPYALVPELIEPMTWTFEDGVARYTRIYRRGPEMWISAIAPVGGEMGPMASVVTVDYPLEIYLDRLADLRRTLLYAAAAGGVGTLVLGLLAARRLTRPISALTTGVLRVAGGDLSRSLPVPGRDEVGQLTRAFNGMLEGLRQRDFIRSAFGRYVSPEVARAILESPEGLRFGGGKRVVTVLMSDLRGYTRFAEEGEPERVMDVLNGYLARMTDIVVESGGTINEFIGDAIFAVFGAPLDQPDHAERAAACALRMQLAMDDINRDHEARGLPRFEMGIGINSGEAVVGNIGSEQRAKYAIVGSAVNVAARVEGATVGGQVFVTDATLALIRDLAEVRGPMALEVKGLRAPLMAHELRGLGGGHALRLPDDEPDRARVPVSLPVACWILEGKAVRPERHEGVVVRLGPREVEARLGVVLPALTNVKFRVLAVADGQESADLYGKVLGAGDAGPGAVRIHLTSVAPAEEALLRRLLAEGGQAATPASSAG